MRHSDIDPDVGAYFFSTQPTPPFLITVWFCSECGHWAGSSYLAPPASNPDWRPRCKMKPPVKCSRPLMEPLRYLLAADNQTAEDF